LSATQVKYAWKRTRKFPLIPTKSSATSLLTFWHKLKTFFIPSIIRVKTFDVKYATCGGSFVDYGINVKYWLLLVLLLLRMCVYLFFFPVVNCMHVRMY